MKFVLLCNRIGPLQAILKGPDSPLRYIALMESRDSREICSYLRGRSNVQEVSKAELFRERSASFRESYIRFMAKLNRENSSIYWWAMPFTNKNPLATSLCRNTAHFLAIADLLENDARPLVVITDSPELAGQVAYWANLEGIKCFNQVKVSDSWRRFLKRHTPAGIIRSAVRTIALWLLSRRYKPAQKLDGCHTVLATLSHPHCFVPPNRYRDAYFGPLIDEAYQAHVNPLILTQLVEHPFQQLKKLAKVEYPVSIVPIEACLTLWSLLACVLRSLSVSLRPGQARISAKIDGKDIGWLINQVAAEGRRSGDLFLNLRVYYGARWLSKRIRISKCIYPFENRAWEKMLVLGMKDGSPKTHLAGYQHASLTPSHINFMFGPGEAEVTPLPDSILTTGGLITQWLEAEGNYPQRIFKTTCALRQTLQDQIELRTSGTPAHVLMALASSFQEYVEALAFLENALGGEDGLELRIRPHPEFSLDSAMEMASLTNPEFYTQSTGSLADDLRWADVVLYASSTVGLEAVAIGIPAIYLDLGSYLNTDPMSGWSDFKWSVSEPAQLAETVRRIRELPSDKFETQQRKGRTYVADYLRPVTADAIAAFWES